MKILMSALACAPGKGSELEVGYRALVAAARRHEVWVLTNADTVPMLRVALADTEVASRIHLEGIDFGLDEASFTRLTTVGFQWYYDRWQRRAAARAVELARQVNFDVVHHVTLASYWTRTAVATVDKPVVWGPVGGGVETPWRLIPVLGWRGLGEELGRVIIRRVVGRFGPARKAQKRAIVIFAQNNATRRRLTRRDDVAILTNATAIDLDCVPRSSTRTKDIYFVGRLIPWKAPILAVRAMRYVQDADCVLHICGDGAERRRLEKAARRWGVRDRVSFEGWLSRDLLLDRLASAGALVHPALHEEAGVCVAEALALGTPVVALNRGGPPVIMTEWSETRSVAVQPSDAQRTAKAIAAAVDLFLADPPDVRGSSVQPRSSFEQELLDAYEDAVKMVSGVRHRLRSAVWGFPRGKPQVFGNTPQALGRGIPVYAFGRRIPVVTQRIAVRQMTIPGLRSLIAERRDRPDPICGWKLWDDIIERVVHVTHRAPEEWLYFRSQWAKQRSSALAIYSGTPLFLVVVEPQGQTTIYPDCSELSFRVPACIDSFNHEGWHVRLIEPLPRYHRAADWDPGRIQRVAEDIPKSLEGQIRRPEGAPLHWRPVHGDFVPWNLRESSDGGLWLVDWEDAGWGPPQADFVRYLVAHLSLRKRSPLGTARATRQMLSKYSVDLEEVASFWLQHRNFRSHRGDREPRRRNKRDATRGAREINALCAIAGHKPTSS